MDDKVIITCALTGGMTVPAQSPAIPVTVAQIVEDGVRAAEAGASVLHIHVREEATGRPVIEGYGLSETSPFVCCNPIDAKEYSGTIGLAFPSTEVSIRDEEGNELPLGETGELCVRGPQVMKGYWNRPEESAHVFTADGWLRTGDMGVMDDRGSIRITDRKKDMIVVSGFKVFPNEIEGVLAMHPGVLECAVIGVPDEKAGEAVKAFVVRKDPALTEADLAQYCRQHLTGYKKPKYIEFRNELPRSNIGKILRRALREPSATEAARSA